MAHSSLTTPSYTEPRTPPLKSSRRRRKREWRADPVSSSSSSVTTATMPSSVNTLPVSVPKLVEDKKRSMPAESSSAASEFHITKSPISMFLVPSVGRKLGHMLSLIRQEDVEFKHNSDYTQIHFPSKKRVADAMLPVKACRLRSLIALAHHLDEEDRLTSPASLLPQSLQPSTPIRNVERNMSTVSSYA